MSLNFSPFHTAKAALGCGAAAVALLAGLPAQAQTYSVPTGQTETVSTAVSGGPVTVTGGGTLVFGNAGNSYSGGTTITGGSTVQIDSDGDLGAASGGLTLGDSSSNGRLSVATSSLTSARDISLGSAGGWVVLNSSSTVTPSATLSGVISGGTLNVGGGGTLTLSGTNTYTGGTFVIGGSTVVVSNDTGIGTGTINLGDAVSTGTLSWSNSATDSSGKAVVLGAGGGTILVNNSTGTQSTTAITMTGVFSGSGGLTVGGGGNLILTGTNTYTGSTTITGSGTMLSVNADAALGTTTGLSGYSGNVMMEGGTLQFNGSFTSARFITLTADGGTFDTDGNNDTLSGPISGAGGLTKVGNGTLTLDGTDTYSGGTTINAGTLQIGDASTPGASISGNVTVNSGGTLAGYGSVLGNVTNVAGIVSPGGSTVGTLNVSGNYTQDSAGTLSIPVSPAGASTLKVGGSANLSGTLAIAYQSGFLHPGTYQILTASSLTDGATITDKVPSVALQAKVTDNGNEIDLVLTQLPNLPSYDLPTIFPALTTAAVDEAQRTTGTLLSHMIDVRSMASADGLTAAWSPTHRIISSSPYGAWFQPTGNFGSLSSHNGAPGFDSSGFGFLTGFDGELARGISAGFATGLNRTMVNENGGASGTIDTPRVAFYASWWSGPFAVDGLVSYAYAMIDSTRPVAGETATSTNNGSEVSGALQGSVNFLLDDWAITPAAGAKYLALTQDSVTEKGTDIYNYTVRNNYTGSLRPYADATLMRRFRYDDQTALVPKLTVGYEEEVLKTARDITVMTEGDDATWRIVGATPSRGSVDVKAGLTVETSKVQALYVDYERDQSSSSTAQAFTAGFRYRW